MKRTARLATVALGLGAALVTAMTTLPAQADNQGAFGKVIRIKREAFQASAGLITFSEKAVGTQNPVYLPIDYGGQPSGVTITFGGFFVGQALGKGSECPRGAAPTGCVAGTPHSPLAIDPSAPPAVVVTDSANPRSPALGGTPKFNGPVSMIFSEDVAGVGLAGGHFDAKGGTAILAFDRSGRQIGGVKNIGLKMEYMALVTEDGTNRIAGLQFALVGPEPQGFAIDDVTVARIADIDQRQIPGFRPPAAETPAAEVAPARPTPSLRDLARGAGEAAPAGGGGAPAGGGGAAGGGRSLRDLVRP